MTSLKVLEKDLYKNDLQPENWMQEQISTARKRLESQAGIETKPRSHFRRPGENPFTKDQREHTTLLFGGLTWRHEHLIEGALRGLGYRCEALPTPDLNAFQIGKEFGNNGQCNPTYFTVGNLIQYLQDLEAKGMSREEIIKKYIFFTAGACGPCRFGMYEAEYRLALRNSGFDKFRVLLFQQSGGLNQTEIEAGLEINIDFFLALINSMNIGDMLNDLGFQIRPYEVEAGKTDRVMEETLRYLHDVLMNNKRFELNGGWKRFLAGIKLEGTIKYLGKFCNQLMSRYYLQALNRVRDQFNEIEMDRFRVKPTVKIIGEFWAQTTEGDGNYNMFRFLEGEGAEVLVEPIGTWITYIIHQFKQKLKDRKGIQVGKEIPVWAERPPLWRLGKRFVSNLRHRKRVGMMTLAENIFKREYRRMQTALGGTLHQLADQYELQRLGHPYYNSRAAGGEGHLEVAKNIYYHNYDLCHMVLSLKPFGCLPSTQSDGVQAAVTELFKEMIYLPVETSGEGEINAHSRVQMALGNARIKAKQEFENALDRTGRSLEELKAYVDEHPELKRPMYKVPHRKGVIGTAANFVLHVADLINDSSLRKSDSNNRANAETEIMQSQRFLEEETERRNN